MGLCAHAPNRRSVASSARNNTTLHRLERNRPAQRLAYSCSIAQAIANYVTLAHQIAFPNKIPGAPGLRCPVLIFGDTANRRVSQTTTFNSIIGSSNRLQGLKVPHALLPLSAPCPGPPEIARERAQCRFGGPQGNCRLRSFPVPRRAPRAACRLLPFPPLRSPESQF